MASFLYCEGKKAASLFIEIRTEINLKSIKKTDDFGVYGKKNALLNLKIKFENQIYFIK